MKGNHPLVTYGGTFMIVLTVRKKKVLKKIIPRERKNPPSKSSKKDLLWELQQQKPLYLTDQKIENQHFCIIKSEFLVFL